MMEDSWVSRNRMQSKRQLAFGKKDILQCNRRNKGKEYQKMWPKRQVWARLVDTRALHIISQIIESL